VRDEDNGDALFLGEPRNLVLERLPRQRVERAERLVHQHHARLLRETARNLHALLHPARELAGKIFADLGEAHLFQQRIGARLAGAARNALALVGERDIGPDAAPGQKRAAVVLEHDRPLARRAVDPLAFGENFARARRHQPGQQPQQRGLAAARRADDREEFAVGDRQIDAVENEVGAEGNAQRARF
jgi:hypothetical protein